MQKVLKIAKESQDTFSATAAVEILHLNFSWSVHTSQKYLNGIIWNWL